MTVKEKLALPRADYPEQAGVSSKEIENLIRDFRESGIEVHSFMILSRGKVAFESWAEPYSPETPHMMYSVSKSFTSTAVGFAVSEGLLSLDTRFVDVFPEYRNEKDKNLEALNVHYLLSMQSGKNVSVFSDKGKNRWIEDFVNSPWGFAPGEGWQYISENQYILCAMLKEVTGMTVTEYLTPRLYEPLGIDVPFWEHDINGIEAGGWGLFLKTEDLAKFIYCYQHNGMYMGRQVIPAEWVQLAQRPWGDNSIVNSDPDGQCGYGYCFWRCGGVNGYRADGMFSQFGIIPDDYDAAFIITASEIDEQKTKECIWRHFPKCLIEPDSELKPEKMPSLSSLGDELPSSEHKAIEKEIEGRIIKFKKNIPLNAAGFPVSILPFPVVYMSGDRAGNISDVVFTFGENECYFHWTEGDEENTIACGMDGISRKTEMTLAQMKFTAAATAAWISDNELQLNIRPVEAVAQRILKFTFNGNKVVFQPSSKMSIRAMSEHIAKDMKQWLPDIPPVQAAGYAAFDRIPNLVDCKHYGKFTDKK